MIRKKLICFDLDGTFLTKSKQISPVNLRLIDSLHAAGHVVAIATGRFYKSAVKVRDRIPAHLDIICSNGAVVETEGEIIRRDQIPVEELEIPYHLARKHDVSLAFDSLYTAYHTKLGWTFMMQYFTNVLNPGEMTIRNVHVRNIEEYMRYAPWYINGIAISRTNPERIQALRRDLEELDLYNIESSAPNNVEIIPRGSHKGTGALILAKRHGIEQQDIIAFGDGENDLRLIETAGLGFAMDNGTPLLKEAADYVIGDNDTDTIAHTLKELLDLDDLTLERPLDRIIHQEPVTR